MFPESFTNTKLKKKVLFDSFASIEGHSFVTMRPSEEFEK